MVVNKLRMNPQKYISELQALLNTISTTEMTIDLTRDHNINIVLPKDSNPFSVLNMLISASPTDPISWSETMVPAAYSELKACMKLDKSDSFQAQDGFMKIQADFILDPVLTILIILLNDPNNVGLLLSENLGEGAVVTFANPRAENINSEGKTLMFFTLYSEDQNL